MERPVVEELHPGRDLDRAFDLSDRVVQGRGDVPQVGRVLLAAGEDGAAVGAEGDEPDLVLVAEGRADRLARGLVPELGRPVVAAGQHGPAVAADGQGPERAVVPQGRGDRTARSSRPRAGPSRSQPPVITVRPSGLKAATETGPSCCSGGTRSLPEAASQSRAFMSSLPVRRVRPSGLKATAMTLPPCRRGWPTGLPVGRVPEPGRPVVAAGQR